MGQSEPEAGQGEAVSEVDAAVAALNRIADAIELLARATAGEFDAPEDEEPARQVDLSGRPI